MKKSIVLLISLLFISALSVLILKNLEDTNSYIKEQNSKENKIQMIVLMNNLQSEISKIFLQNKNKIDEFLSQGNQMSIPLYIKNSELNFTITQYDKIDINLINQNKIENKTLENLFNENDISGYESLKNIYIKEKNKYQISTKTLINNSKQLDDIINRLIKETYNDDISKIKNNLGFISAIENENLYEIYVEIKHLDEFSKAYYILDKKGEVKYFESSFK